MKKIIVSVSNDLYADNRVHRVCSSLTGMGFSVLLVGRCYRHSPEIGTRIYHTTRLRMVFRKGPFFYAEFNIRLFLFLLFRRFDILLSNDLDTLSANVLAGKLKRRPVVYDSHEYFTEVPELVHRPTIKRIWKRIEKIFIPHVSAAYTVSKPIADAYESMYNIPFSVLRNIPRKDGSYAAKTKSKTGKPSVIYQGALNLGRGLENAIRAMQHIPEATLIIAGSGDIEEKLRAMANELPTQNIEFTGRLPEEKLRQLTQGALLGISLEEDLGLNYRFALPNKLFDYIHAGIPVLVSNLPEMRLIVEQYNIGLAIGPLAPEELAGIFRKALFDETLRLEWTKGIEIARNELTWENEEKILAAIFRKFNE